MSWEALPDLAFQSMLLLARLGGAVMLLPGLGEQEVPVALRLALALALVALLLPPLAAGLPPLPAELPELLRLLLGETAIGLRFGMLGRLVALAMAQAGQMVALMIGLSSPLQTDPMLGAQSTATGRLFALFAATLVLASGLYAIPLEGLVRSYALLPPGAPLPLGSTAEALAQGLADSLGVALRLAGPLVLAGILGNFALALLARVAPQVQVFALAAPVQIIGGLLLLMLVLPSLAGVWLASSHDGFLAMTGPP
ncbi:flagellar biosynthetic protein FliR [Siccirubricoccus deserti]|uniref:Flagellar biosynthetic protein FliR n=1 Tax=Siccirubricoccus deserti TaxID=2013562 RepID=A0A9X0UFI3_9PROT|nr:flagellar biosynthetic protein FliR [Siccirubricoccus deserti]MBC4017908.1 flagellar biosynthetic protein FliR [Siccirubricoccus deserti]GGC61619.1 flagellar biosynthetic protein FliR [Siccirubricoccus deserti]